MSAADVRQYLLKLLLAVLPLGGIPLVNYIVDPGRLFHPQPATEQVVRYLRRGYNVTGHGSIDDRLLQQRLIAQLDSPPALAIFGSSRVQLLSSAELGRNLVNNGVGAATLNDVFATYQFYRKRGIVPQEVLFGVDPWMLNENQLDLPLRRNSPDVESLRRTLGVRPSVIGGILRRYRMRTASELFSPSYFRTSIRTIMDPARGRDAFVATRNSFNTDGTRLTDGSVTYGDSDRGATEQSTLMAAEGEGTAPFFGFDGFRNIASSQRNMLLNFIRLMRADGVSVRLILMPVHPLVYEKLRKSTEYISPVEIERTVRQVAAEAAVPVTGSYDPAALRWESVDFLDGKHLRAERAVELAREALR